MCTSWRDIGIVGVLTAVLALAACDPSGSSGGGSAWQSDSCAGGGCEDASGDAGGDPGVTLPDGGSVSCVGLTNPLAGTCAASFFDVATCLQLGGGCSLEPIDETHGEIVWESGSKMIWSEGEGGSIIGEMRGPTGTLCGTSTSTPVPESDDMTTTFATPDGQTFGVDSQPDNTVIITCPGGQTVSVSPGDADALGACTGLSGADAASCTWSGIDPGGPGTCAAGCNEGYVCCEAIDPPLCMPEAVCENVCTGPSDCGEGQTCCMNDAGFGMCAPDGAC